ncbi:DUF2087 domain-containing protein [Tuanshanicoccus lijuaniae]|uniref:DUF2087 domain-containing protein n=1 Tax=Aerococcaceae bacterium zg-1292 TaxID=2774330 RepID=UPI001936F687|nr:DUF2087 domain-containing protein [Aerococcaceae bacterium zg-1292]MBF6625811.1 DUF2087 domain-containing protein [Aerococcaceae bacterium zg-BR9]MBF6978628.1 DUF2087 domain-containing protein [Aerococcaceae bacterium zg-BR22]QQA37778.1 DUF2087 domain-containing protein [Aerococcaceae bacterium zg-1292]
METIERYMRNGKLTVIPKKEKNKVEILKFFVGRLENHPQEIFSEKELNELIAEYYDDYAIIRRYLVDYGFVLRDDYGKEYRVKP